MNAIFVLVHGGFHGGWCWERVVPLLEGAGHVAVAPDLPGMGTDTTPHDQVTLESTAAYVIRVVEAQQHPVILAGHSMGGMVISEVAERIPDRIVGLIYVSAVLMAVGEDAGNQASLAGQHNLTPTDDGNSVDCDRNGAADRFYNTTDPAIARAAVERLAPQPIATMTAPLTATAAGFGRLPRAFVECTEDRAIPLAHQRAMQAALPCDPVFTFETDHSPFLSSPERLAECLIAASERFRALRTPSTDIESYRQELR